MRFISFHWLLGWLCVLFFLSRGLRNILAKLQLYYFP
jgi:hypothetical protein